MPAAPGQIDPCQAFGAKRPGPVICFQRADGRGRIRPVSPANSGGIVRGAAEDDAENVRLIVRPMRPLPADAAHFDLLENRRRIALFGRAGAQFEKSVQAT
jgi:hypothetical protein